MSEESDGAQGHGLRHRPSDIDLDVRSTETQVSSRRRKILASLAAGGSLSLSGCLSLYSFGTPPEEWRTVRPIEDPPYKDDDEVNDIDEDDTPDDEIETYDIRYYKQGVTIPVGSDQNLLDAGEEQGFDLPFRCREGWCGVCTARLWGDALDRVEMIGNQFLTDDEIRDGFTLTCVGYPRSNFTLETGERDALDR